MPSLSCPLENGYPVSINFSEDNNSIIVCTNQRRMFVCKVTRINFSVDLTLNQIKFRVEDVAQKFWNQWQCRYTLTPKTPNSPMVPICAGNQSNVVVAGDEYGNLYFWKDPEEVKENVSCNFTGHASQVQKVELTADDSHLMSMGLNDNTVLQWRLSLMHEESGLGKRRGGRMRIYDDTLINELNFCFAQ